MYVFIRPRKGKGGVKSHPHHIRQEARRRMQASRRSAAKFASGAFGGGPEGQQRQ